MVLHWPPPLSFPSALSSSKTLLFANAQALPIRRRAPLFPASPVSSIPSREGSYGATIQAFLLLRCASRVRFSDHGCLFFPSFSAPSDSRAPDMTRLQKRLCKTPEVFNSRSSILVSDGIVNSGSAQSSDANFRVLAFPSRGSSEIAVAEHKRPADALLQGHNAEKSGPRRFKSAEELHFEAIQDYHLRYENEDSFRHVNDAAYGAIRQDASLPEASRSPRNVHAAVVGRDKANTPVNESKYVDVCDGVSPWHSDKNVLHSLKSPKNLNLGKQTSSPDDASKPIISTKVLQFPLQAEGKNAERGKRTQLNTLNLGLLKSIARRPPQDIQSTSLQNSAVIADKSKPARTSDLDSSQDENESDNEDDVQHKNSPTNDEDMQSEEENTKFEASRVLSEEQKIRMELNKAAAFARRNTRACEEVVLEAQAKGLSFPKFENLLVDKSWMEVLGAEFQKPYMERLQQFVSQEAAGRIPIYPPPAKLFNAFNSCPFNKVKVVIIGQDPYHGPGQAMGLCFSVEKDIKLPSSLSNIFLEVESDLHCDFPLHGNLEKWAHQGVLLLNTVLTVRDHHANSHAKKGWELFTDAAIRALAQHRSDLVFLLWGNQAQEKLRLINKTSHHILKASHPSGISAHRGFFKCRHFSKTNQILVDQGLLPIDWQL